MSVSGVSSSGGFDVSQMAAKMVKKSDANEDGSLDKTEFTNALKSRGVSEEDAAKKFDSIDKNKTGKITQSDIEADMKANPKKAPSAESQAAGGRPAGGQRPEGAGKSESTTTSSSSKTYEASDTNEDGTVSAVEELTYSLKIMAEAKAKEADATQSNAQFQSGNSQKMGSNVDVTV